MIMKGIVLKAISSFYYVSCNDQLYECKARGNFRISGISPLVGDRVEFDISDNNKGVINSICERKSVLKRPLIANIDKLFIVSSYKTPAPDTFMIDRLTAISVFNGITPVIVFNKSDMGDFKDIAGIYERAGFKTYTVSALSGEGIDLLKLETQNCVSAFAGNSGVGKSSIINALFGDLSLKTGEVSEKLGRGRHTTRHTELFRFGDSFVADTPGFAAIESDNTLEFKNELANCFPDFSDYISGCRYSTCTHTCEPGCQLIEAVENGLAERSRYNSFLLLFEELKDLKEWSVKQKKV